MKSVLDSPPLKEGTGTEIRKLHDNVVQHLRALKAMDHEPSSPFVTSALELKIDQTSMFEWQRHSQSADGIPHYSDLLSFLKSCAQATESMFVESNTRKLKHDTSIVRKNHGNALACTAL